MRGKSNRKKSSRPVKIRRRWTRKPETQIKQSDKLYKRQRDKKRLERNSKKI